MAEYACNPKGVRVVFSQAFLRLLRGGNVFSLSHTATPPPHLPSLTERGRYTIRFPATFKRSLIKIFPLARRNARYILSRGALFCKIQTKHKCFIRVGGEHSKFDGGKRPYVRSAQRSFL
jgi:hypothetical protein